MLGWTEWITMRDLSPFANVAVSSRVSLSLSTAVCLSAVVCHDMAICSPKAFADGCKARDRQQ